MLIVDPVKRITIAEIRQLPWFQQDLPRYLQPLPMTPAALDSERKEFDFGMTPMSAPTAEGDGSEDSKAIYTSDLGYLSPSILEELQTKMVTFTAEEILDLLQQPGENQLKVAYQLVRDQRRIVKTSALNGDDRTREEMKAWFEASPPAWNEGLEERRAKAIQDGAFPTVGPSTSSARPSRQTSLKRPSRRRARDPSAQSSLSASHEQDESSQLPDDANETFASDAYDSELADADADDAGLDTDVSDGEGLGEDDDLFTDEELDQPLTTGVPSGICILETSIPSRRPWGTEGGEGSSSSTGSASAVPQPMPSKRSRPRWHFGIRSRSPPMEIIMELYRTLEALGMEWRAKPKKQRRQREHDDGEPAPSTDDMDNGTDLFFIETRWRVENVIVRMDLQLYSVDSSNYLVDFRNVTYVRLDDPTPPLTRNGSDEAVEGQEAQDEKRRVEEALDSAAAEAARSGANDLEQARLKRLLGRAASKPSLAPAVPEGRKEVCSPFLFLECATRLIVELAGGG